MLVEKFGLTSRYSFSAPDDLLDLVESTGPGWSGNHCNAIAFEPAAPRAVPLAVRVRASSIPGVYSPISTPRRRAVAGVGSVSDSANVPFRFGEKRTGEVYFLANLSSEEFTSPTKQLKPTGP